MSVQSKKSWKKVQLQEVCQEITVGFVSSMSQHYVDEGIPFLRSQNILPFYLNLNPSDLKYIPFEFHTKLKKSALQPGDVVVVRTGYPGTACVVPESLPISNCADLVIIRPSKEVNPYYLTCIFNSTWGKEVVSGRLVGSAQQHFNVSAAKAMVVNVPPLATQQRIADILSTYDRLIDNNNRRIALLEESIHQLYKEWFVRSRFPGYESVKVVNGIPEGWNRKTLKDIALSIRQSIHPSNTEPNTPYVGLEHIPRQSIALTSWGYSHEVDSNKFVFTKGDILFGKIRPYFHKVVFAPVNGICSSDAIVIRPINQDLFGLTLSLVSTVAFVDYTSKTSKEGSKMPRANWDVMQQYPILIPSPKLLQEFNTLVNLVTNQITNLIFTNQRLRQARDLLLPRLMNGSIAV